VGPVVGGVVGGLAVLLLLGFLIWRLVKRQSRLDNFFNRDEGLDDYRHGPRHKGPVLEKPSYQYGMVGQSVSNPVSQRPLQSPPNVQNTFGNSSGVGQTQGLPQSTTGQAVIGNDGSLGQASGQVGGQIGGPLGNGGGSGQGFGPPGALGTNGGLGQTGHGVVISNMPPLITGITSIAGASGLLAAATSARSSSSGTSSHALGPPVSPARSQGGYLPIRESWNTTSHGYGQALAGPSTPPPNNNNGRVLTKRPSVASTSSAYSRSSWVGESSTNPIADDNRRGSAPPILPSMEGSSRQQQYQREAPLYDEQGRPRNMPPEKSPLVHLDGALYQEPHRSDSRLENEPPAYIE